jgi:hypothetical protein
LELRRKITDPGVSLRGNGRRPRAKDTAPSLGLPFILRRSHTHIKIENMHEP